MMKAEWYNGENTIVQQYDSVIMIIRWCKSDTVSHYYHPTVVVSLFAIVVSWNRHYTIAFQYFVLSS